MFNPPESKHTPLPTNETHSYDSGLPLYDRLMKTGYFSLALPTACINLNPSLINSSPLITVIFKDWFCAIYCALVKKYWGVASSPLIFTHYFALILSLTSSKIYYLSLKS